MIPILLGQHYEDVKRKLLTDFFQTMKQKYEVSGQAAPFNTPNTPSGFSTSTSTANYTTNPPLTTSAYRETAVISPPGSLSSIREPFDPLNRSYASLPSTQNPYVTFAPPNPVINFHP